jgi:hypothetical protein
VEGLIKKGYRGYPVSLFLSKNSFISRRALERERVQGVKDLSEIPDKGRKP